MKSIIVFIILTHSALAYTLGNKVFLDEIDDYKNKNVALVVNQNSLIDNKHVIDVYKNRGLKILKLFALEHGVRGDYSAGTSVDDQVDSESGIPIISLYGKKKKPSPEDLKDIDLIIYDIQDVGVRFYTFIASLGNIMESINKRKIDLIILDRPNPNNYISGPVGTFSTFLSPYPIPIVYGLTIGELALMIQGESWRAVEKVNLKVIKMLDYNRNDPFEMIKMPSPNLRSIKAIKNYPTLALFEPINLSIGRGTYKPFTIIGKPDYSLKEISFTPQSIKGMAEKPKYLNEKCFGQSINLNSFDFELFMKVFKRENLKVTSLSFFQQLVGDEQISKLIINKTETASIIKAWQNKLNAYKEKRKKYLIY